MLPLSEGQRWQGSVDIELRKYGVHDNEYRIRGLEQGQRDTPPW